MQPTRMEVNALVQYVAEMKEKRGFDGTSLEQEMVLLMEEVGEVAREVRNIIWREKGAVSPERRRDLAYEVVDCLIYLLSIAHMAGVDDLEGYFREKEAINTRRFGI